MSHRFHTSLTALAGALTILPAAAQAPANPPDGPPGSSYRSAFEGYRPYADGELQEWRRSNDTVHQIGGWRAYARETSADAQRRKAALEQQKPSPSQPASPSTDPRAGHHR